MSTSKPRILVIDDTPANLFMLGAALSADYDLQTATSGAMGIELALKWPPDLILLDVMMPRMDGFETCRRLKAHEALKQVPVVFVTALTDAESETEGLILGAVDYIAKPINVGVARQRVKNLLERESLRKQVIAQRDQLCVLLAERQAIEDDLRIASVAFNSQHGMTITDPQGVILRVNPSFTRLTGYSAQEAVGKTSSILKSGRHDAAFYQRMWGALKEKGFWQGAVWNKRKDGQIYAEMLAITAVLDAAGAVTHYIGSFTDITEDKQAEAEIHRLAYYDALTRLPNRRLLQDRLGQALTACSRNGMYGAVFFIDLDNFKALNDIRGHDVGDQLLVEVARCLRSSVREGDTVARLGGDEYVLLLEALSDQADEAAARAKRVWRKVRDSVAKPITLQGTDYPCKLSVGISLFDRNDTVEELFKRAELALYQAKNAGRDRVRFFDPGMQAAMEQRSALEQDLAQAVASAQLRLHFQVQVDAGGRVRGAEALLRWLHPQRGMVSPAEFIPLAEATGLILPIGHWVLETACVQLKAWEQDARTNALELSINVSARQFKQADFVGQVRRALEASRANPAQLKIELTESVVLENIEGTIEKMLAIKRLGVKLSMDDFGTGYSSLAYLAQLPLDQIKIDQSFVRSLPGAQKDEAIVRTIISLGRELGLNVIAEGVETQAQRGFLEEHGCHAFQGYLFGRPVPAEELVRQLPEA